MYRKNEHEWQNNDGKRRLKMNNEGIWELTTKSNRKLNEWNCTTATSTATAGKLYNFYTWKIGHQLVRVSFYFTDISRYSDITYNL